MFIMLDLQGEVIMWQGWVEVLNDEDCWEFFWYFKFVLEFFDFNVVQFNEGFCFVFFVDFEDDGEFEVVKQLIQLIVEKIIVKYKVKEEEVFFLFFVVGEDDMIDFL